MAGSGEQEQCYQCVFARRGAFLFPLGAGRFQTASFEFALADFQEVPRAVPPYEVEGDVVAGTRPELMIGGVRVVPASRIRHHREGRILAEHGDVIGHPDVVGDHPGWRYEMGHSFDTVDEWQQHLDRTYRSLRTPTFVTAGISVAFIAVLAWLAILAIVRAPSLPTAAGFVIVALLIARRVQVTKSMLDELLRVARPRRLLDAARATAGTEPRTIDVRVWWSTGDGSGPTAVASVFDATHGQDVPVVGLAHGVVSDEVASAEVRGTGGRSPVIDIGGVRLWPAGHPPSTSHVAGRRTR